MASKSKFVFPVNQYFDEGKNAQSEFSQFDEEMDVNFFQVVSAQLSNLNFKDRLIIEDAMVSGKLKRFSFQNIYLKKWDQISASNSNNPMYPLLEKDEEYSKTFSQLESGGNQRELNERIERFHGQAIASVLGVVANDVHEMMKDVVGDDWYSRVQQATSLADFKKDFAKKFKEFERKHPEQAKKLRREMEKSDTLKKLFDPPEGQNTKVTDKSKKTQVKKASSFISKRMGRAKNLVKGNFLKYSYDTIKDGFNKAKETKVFKDGWDKIKDSKVLKKAQPILKYADKLKIGPIGTVTSVGFNAYNNITSEEVMNDLKEGKAKRAEAKVVVGTAIDTVSNFGVADGVISGAMIGIGGGPYGVIGGAAIGGALGFGNQMAKFLWPNGYKKIKTSAYKAIDWTADKVLEVGNGIKKKANQLTRTATKAISDKARNVVKKGTKKLVDNAKEFFNPNKIPLPKFGF